MSLEYKPYKDVSNLPIDLINEISKRGRVVNANFHVTDFEHSKWYGKIWAQINWARDNLYDLKPRFIAFDFYERTGINAFIWSSPPDDQYPFDFIGMSHGTIIEYEKLFERIFGSAEVSLFFENDLKNKDNICSELRDKIKSYIKEIMKDLCVVFVIAHELYHARNGHIDFLKNYPKKGLGKLSDKKIFQAFEMDADSGACACLMTYGGVQKSRLHSQSNFKDEAEYYANKLVFDNIRSILQFSTYAMCCAFRLHPYSQWDFDKSLESTHPQTVVRQSFVSNSFSSLISSKPEMYDHADPKVMMDYMVEAKLFAERDYCKAHGIAMDLKPYMSIYREENMPKFFEEMRWRADAWSSIVDELELYKRGGNLYRYPEKVKSAT